MFLLPNHDLNPISNPYTIRIVHSVVHNKIRIPHGLTTDTLAQVLHDPCFLTIGLENHEEWTIKLKKLNIGKKIQLDIMYWNHEEC